MICGDAVAVRLDGPRDEAPGRGVGVLGQRNVDGR